MHQLKLVASSRKGDLLDLVSGGEADHGAVLGVLGFSFQVLQLQALVHRLPRGIHILPIQVVPLKIHQPLHHTHRRLTNYERAAVDHNRRELQRPFGGKCLTRCCHLPIVAVGTPGMVHVQESKLTDHKDSLPTYFESLCG